MTNTTENKETTPKPVKAGYTEDEKKEMTAYCGLTQFDESTIFFDIRYTGNRNGRTCLILGALGMHARIDGDQTGIIHDEKLGMDVKQELDYDVTLSVKRPDVFAVLTKRVEPDWSKVTNITDAELAKKPKYQYDVVIYYNGTHSVTIYGLSEENAGIFKKIIWSWMNYQAQVQRSAD